MFTQKIRSRTTETIRLYTAIINGDDAWFILHVDKPKLQLYLHDVKSGKPINLPDYGTVLHRGWGSTPSEELLEQVRQAF